MDVRPTYFTVRAPVRHNLAAATVCSDLSDNQIGGTLEPLASLRRLSFLCALPSVTSGVHHTVLADAARGIVNSGSA